MSWSNGRLLGSPMLGNKWNIENEFSFCSLVGENIQRLLVRKWKWTWDMKIFSQSGNLFYNSLGSSFAFPVCLDGFLGVSDLGFWFRICSDVVVSDSGVAIVVQWLFWWDIEMRHGKCKHDWISPKKNWTSKIVHQKKWQKNPRVHFGWWFQTVALLRLRFPKKIPQNWPKVWFSIGFGTPNPKTYGSVFTFFSSNQNKSGNFMAEFFRYQVETRGLFINIPFGPTAAPCRAKARLRRILALLYGAKFKVTPKKSSFTNLDDVETFSSNSIPSP